MPTHDIYKEDADAVAGFLDTYCRAEMDRYATSGRRWVTVSYREMTRSRALAELAEDRGFHDLDHMIREEPDFVHDLLVAGVEEYDFGAAVETAGVSIRIGDLPDDMVHGVGELWKAETGDFCGVRGQVQKVAGVQKQAVELTFECQRCGTTTTIDVDGSPRTQPASCDGCEREGPFTVRHEESEYRPYQLARIQQPPEETKGGDAAHIDLPLTGSLVEAVDPGDRATFAGTQELAEAGDDDELLFDTYLEPESAAVEETDFEEIDTSEYQEEIEAIAAGEYGEPIDAVTGSIAPKVHGHDDIKQAMALQLFGGCELTYPDGARDRGDMHMLLIGAPGTAKSTLLEAAEELSPRSTYASGKGASAAGMTAAAVRDDFGEKEWALEAGALVMANKGIACVDEIDKIDDDARSSMHTALESQRININKAGINATLPAETSLLAAGNPKYGRFDDYASESLSEQIDLGPTLLSRFDLIFVLRDDPDREEDTAIAEHIIESGRAANGASGSEADVEPTIPADTLRAYIAYAKQHVRPQIEDDAVAGDLVKSFVEWRMLNGEADDVAVPVTFRKLEGVRRLAQASARLRLSETVQKQDVKLARELVMGSLKQVGLDEDEGTFDADIIEASSSKSQRERIKIVKEIVAANEPDFDTGVPIGKVLDWAEEDDIRREKAKHEIEKLKGRGELYEPSGGCLRTT